jgi:hypothetical protein
VCGAQEYCLQAVLSQPFSALPPVLPSAAVLSGVDTTLALDVNGLMLTAGQLSATVLGTSSLRSLTAYPTVSDTFALTSDRSDVGLLFRATAVADCVR